MNFEVKFNRRHYYIQPVIIARMEVSNIHWDFAVFLWETNPLNLGMKYQKVMKRMRERMRTVMRSLVHPGYLEMTLSMIPFFLFSLSLANTVAHTHTLMHLSTHWHWHKFFLLYFCLRVLCFQDKTTYRNKKKEEKAAERESHWRRCCGGLST